MSNLNLQIQILFDILYHIAFVLFLKKMIINKIKIIVIYFFFILGTETKGITPNCSFVSTFPSY